MSNYDTLSVLQRQYDDTMKSGEDPKILPF